jgi:hypothetical protein
LLHLRATTLLLSRQTLFCHGRRHLLTAPRHRALALPRTCLETALSVSRPSSASPRLSGSSPLSNFPYSPLPTHPVIKPCRATSFTPPTCCRSHAFFYVHPTLFRTHSTSSTPQLRLPPRSLCMSACQEHHAPFWTGSWPTSWLRPPNRRGSVSPLRTYTRSRPSGSKLYVTPFRRGNRSSLARRPSLVARRIRRTEVSFAGLSSFSASRSSFPASCAPRSNSSRASTWSPLLFLPPHSGSLPARVHSVSGRVRPCVPVLRADPLPLRVQTRRPRPGATEVVRGEAAEEAAAPVAIPTAGEDAAAAHAGAGDAARRALAAAAPRPTQMRLTSTTRLTPGTPCSRRPPSPRNPGPLCRLARADPTRRSYALTSPPPRRH